MCDLKKALDAGGHCVLEMPSGTGKRFSTYQQILQIVDNLTRKNCYPFITYCCLSKASWRLQKTNILLSNDE